MVKKIYSSIAIIGLCFIASSASAVTNWDNSTSPGSTVTITVDTTVIPGGTDLVFQPSAQVNISGGSESGSFATMAGHEGTQGKDSGQNYGMASDSSNVFWVVAPATYTAITAVDSAAFTGYNRN